VKLSAVETADFIKLNSTCYSCDGTRVTLFRKFHSSNRDYEIIYSERRHVACRPVFQANTEIVIYVYTFHYSNVT
jgi:hypothetical protein